MDIYSKKVNVSAKSESLFETLTNCNNMGKYIPNDKVKDWQSTVDNCSFTVEGAGKIELAIVEKHPFSVVVFSIGNAVAKNVKVVFHIDKTSEDSCELHAETSFDVPFFMAQMLKNPLQKFMDMLIDSIKIAAERNN
jgi:carbon monoxide dehydrogenase subunit G